MSCFQCKSLMLLYLLKMIKRFFLLLYLYEFFPLKKKSFFIRVWINIFDGWTGTFFWSVNGALSGRDDGSQSVPVICSAVSLSLFGFGLKKKRSDFSLNSTDVSSFEGVCLIMSKLGSDSDWIREAIEIIFYFKNTTENIFQGKKKKTAKHQLIIIQTKV